MGGNREAKAQHTFRPSTAYGSGRFWGNREAKLKTVFLVKWQKIGDKCSAHHLVKLSPPNTDLLVKIILGRYVILGK